MVGFVEFCKDYITAHMDEYVGEEVYGCDVSWLLMDGANADGTLTYNRDRAVDYLHEWWDDCGDFFNYEKDNFGEVLHNPFENPEAFMTAMVIEGIGYIFNQVPVLKDTWNDKIVLTDEVVSEILDFVEEFDEETLF